VFITSLVAFCETSNVKRELNSMSYVSNLSLTIHDWRFTIWVQV